MSQIEGSMGSMELSGELVFVATAARAAVVGTGGGVRSAMARAAQLLELDRPATATPARASRAAAAGRVRAHRKVAAATPARRRTRRYAERQPLVASR
jgi:hypothetical protein